jgi:rhamnosyltransferase subunit B
VSRGCGKRVILTTHGTLGDLHPYLAIALELQRRGHRPVIATSEYHRRKIEAVGLAFHPVRPEISFDDHALHRRLTEPRRGLERVIREFMLPALRQSYDDLLSAVEKDGGADLIVSQILVFAARLIAEKKNVPWVSTELQPGAFMSAHDPPVLAPLPALSRLRGLGTGFHRMLFCFARSTARSWSEPVRCFRRELGLAPGEDPLFEGRHSPRLVLALFSRVFADPQPDWPARTRVTGFSFYDETAETAAGLAPEIAQFLDNGEAPIIFTLGSSAVWGAGDFYVESLAAAQKVGRRALLLVGSDPRNRLPRPLPKNVMALPYVPYVHVFPRASAVVHQAGIGTTAQALRAGTPMLVVPFGGDQYDNAARIERLGVGRMLMRKKYKADRVAAALREIVKNPRYLESAAALKQPLMAEDGVQAACDALEDQLRHTA